MKTVLKRMSARRSMLYALLAGGHLSFGFALQAANQLRQHNGILDSTPSYIVQAIGCVYFATTDQRPGG